MLEHRRKDNLLIEVFDTLKKVDLSHVTFESEEKPAPKPAKSKVDEEFIFEPAAALAALAKKTGKSKADAERYYADAKKQLLAKTKKLVKDLTGKDYKMIMGITKKRLGLPVKAVA